MNEIRSERKAKMRALYVIVDPEATKGRDVVEVAEAALRGGASVIQLRDKTRDKGEVLEIARAIKGICDKYDGLFIVNDDADIAYLSQAHGLHVGANGLARRRGEARPCSGADCGAVEQRHSRGAGIRRRKVPTMLRSARFTRRLRWARAEAHGRWGQR